MAKAERLKLIKQIEKQRKSRLIAYITSTRPNLEVPMAMDAVRRIYNHLLPMASEGKRPAIDLFLHSNGGDGIVPWRLVTLIREHAKRCSFSVLVPHHAFSAATLMALGADSVVMHPMGMLGPTDPTVANPFNPPDPTNPQQRIGISVEDVTAYIALIREDAGIQHEDQVVQAFCQLAEKVHPLALGNVKRSLSQSRMMATKLLSLHMDARKEEHKISEIVDKLTSKLFYHGHPINRDEAKEQVGLSTVEYPDSRTEEAMWRLYLEYEKEIRMAEPFSMASEFLSAFPNQKPDQAETTKPVVAKLAFIESAIRTDVVAMTYELCGLKRKDGVTQVQMINRNQGWGTE
jgi:hypothetical protein